MEQIRVEQFALLFAGLTRAKGRYVSTTDPSQLVTGSKAKGKATTVQETVTVEDYRKHLAGELSLGIVPIRDDGTCVFGAIDIDQYAGLDHQALVKALEALGIRAMVCRSKSGGAHLYVFIQEPGVPAPVFIAFLKNLRTVLGIDYRKAREIFPKQAKQQGGIGNWINLPYFGDSSRKAIKSDGTEYSLEEFLDTAVRLDPKEISVTADQTVLVPTELPPCLERLVQDGVPAGQRNEALFNFTVFAAKKFQLDRGNTMKVLDVINTQVCTPSVPSRELNTTLDSVLKHEYNYRCDQSPLVDVCDKVKCAMRPYGPPASMRPSNIPEIERIEVRGDEVNETRYYVKLSTCPKMVVCDAKALFNYDLLRQYTLDTLNVMLPSVKKKDWDTYITARWTALSEQVRVAKERSKSGMSEVILDQWIRDQGTNDVTEFDLGNPYVEGNRVYISLLHFCRRVKPVMSGKPDFPAAATFLEDNGWEKIDRKIGDRFYSGIWTKQVADAEITRTKTEEVREISGEVIVHAPVATPGSMLEDLDWSQFNPKQENTDDSLQNDS